MELAERAPAPLWRRLNLLDWLYALALALGAGYALSRYGAYMDVYEEVILVAAVPVFGWLGWRWRPIRNLLAGVAVLALFAVSLYGSELGRAEQTFFLKYLISSQSAILWMCALYFMATAAYWLGIASRSAFALSTGTALTWAATLMGLTGLLVRWYESYLIGADIGHIPISNLYEVFVLFAIITSLLYLYYEEYYASKSMGAFVSARDFGSGRIPALVHVRPPGAPHPAARARAAVVVDEDPRAGQFRRLRRIRPGRDGGRSPTSSRARASWPPGFPRARSLTT